MIQLIGTLATPMGMPMIHTEIRVTSLTNGLSQLGISGSTNTDSAGNYNFNLVNGKHRIEVLQDNEFYTLGDALVDDNTNAAISLTTLLIEYTAL